MDEEPKTPWAAWAWMGLIAFWAALALLACLASCASSAAQLRADCVGAGGTFIARKGTMTTEGGEYPAVMFLCVFNGKAA